MLELLFQGGQVVDGLGTTRRTRDWRSAIDDHALTPTQPSLGQPPGCQGSLESQADERLVSSLI